MPPLMPAPCDNGDISHEARSDGITNGVRATHPSEQGGVAQHLARRPEQNVVGHQV